ncbi:MAG: hypothetical protein IKC09_08320 [Oscillospiraceae bacterium]|nr:hypothetical protein [Oscillospiraceae bacterium]
MKKVIAWMIVLAMCLSLAGCGNQLEKQADEVAEKLEGTWTFSWNAPIGKMKVVFEFSNVDGNAGTLKEKMYIGGELMQNYTGVFGVSIQEDGVIDCTNMGKIGNNGTIEKLENPDSYTLFYTYEDGKLTLIYNDIAVTK